MKFIFLFCCFSLRTVTNWPRISIFLLCNKPDLRSSTSSLGVSLLQSWQHCISIISTLPTAQTFWPTKISQLKGTIQSPNKEKTHPQAVAMPFFVPWLGRSQEDWNDRGDQSSTCYSGTGFSYSFNSAPEKPTTLTILSHTNASRQWDSSTGDQSIAGYAQQHHEAPTSKPHELLWAISTTSSCKSRYRVCWRGTLSDKVLTSYLSCVDKTSPPLPALPSLQNGVTKWYCVLDSLASGFLALPFQLLYVVFGFMGPVWDVVYVLQVRHFQKSERSPKAGHYLFSTYTHAWYPHFLEAACFQNSSSKSKISGLSNDCTLQ